MAKELSKPLPDGDNPNGTDDNLRSMGKIAHDFVFTPNHNYLRPALGEGLGIDAVAHRSRRGANRMKKVHSVLRAAALGAVVLAGAPALAETFAVTGTHKGLSLIHISEPTRPY